MGSTNPQSTQDTCCPPAGQCQTSPPNPQEVEALFPAGTQDLQQRTCSVSSLCSYGMTPLIMQGALRQVLIQHFADTRNILNSTLRSTLERSGVWRADAQTGIVIESLHKWRPELTEARPGLILKEGAWQWQRMGIGDSVGEDWLTGRKFYQGYWQGSHTIFALAKEGPEAQIIAIEAMKCFLRAAAIILEQFELQRFVPVSIGEVSALKESTEHYVVPITVAYTVPEAWHMTPEAPRLKQIVFTASETFESY